MREFFSLFLGLCAYADTQFAAKCHSTEGVNSADDGEIQRANI